MSRPPILIVTSVRVPVLSGLPYSTVQSFEFNSSITRSLARCASAISASQIPRLHPDVSGFQTPPISRHGPCRFTRRA